MEHENIKRMLWVVFRIKGQIYAIAAESVSEMVVVPKIYTLPEAPKDIRGVINLRSHVMPVIDLRSLMGMQPLGKELTAIIEMLHQRKEDHVHWMKELEQSLEEKREFQLATDPHQCAFGKWYDTFETDSQALSFYLRKFEEPHRRIHEIAYKVKEYQKVNQFKQAHDVIEAASNRELREMLLLFSGIGQALEETKREIALILNTDRTGRYAVSVDRVESVEKLTEFDIQGADGNIPLSHTGLIAIIAKRCTGDIVQILNADNIMRYATYLDNDFNRERQ